MPSERARDRLGAEMSSEVAATRAAWTDALLRSDAALRHGRPEEARQALDDQRRLLTQLQQRLDRAVSSALVEREAEQAIQDGWSATTPEPRFGPTPAASETLPPAQDEPATAPPAGASLRQQLPRILAGAATAALVGLVATMVTTTPTPAPEIAAMEEQEPAAFGDLEVPDDGFDASPAPADELRGLGSWVPSGSREAGESPAAEDPAPSATDAPAEPPSPQEGPEGPGAPAPQEPDASESSLAPRDADEEPTPEVDVREDVDGPRDTEDVEADEDVEPEGLMDRLRFDRAMAQRLGEQFEALWKR